MSKVKFFFIIFQLVAYLVALAAEAILQIIQPTMSSDRQAPKWVVDKPSRLVSSENLVFTGGKSARVTCKEEKGSANAAATARTKS